MTITAIVLLTISAIMHVAWNLGGRISGPTPKFFRVSNLYGGLILIPATIIGFPIFHQANPTIWILIMASAFFQALYFSGLSGAYFAGHISEVYPLARSWPALLVVFVSLILGNGDAITPFAIFGILLILAGSTAIPLKSFREIKLSTYANKSCAYALLAAFGTAGYSILDDIGLRNVADNTDIANWKIAALWLGYESLAAVSWLYLFERINIFQAPKGTSETISRPHTIVVAILMAIAYTLVLLSYTLVDNISYVAGFRQLSIPLGTLAGVILLREPGPPLKWIGVTLMFAGLVMVALG